MASGYVPIKTFTKIDSGLDLACGLATPALHSPQEVSFTVLLMSTYAKTYLEIFQAPILYLQSPTYYLDLKCFPGIPNLNRGIVLLSLKCGILPQCVLLVKGTAIPTPA